MPSVRKRVPNGAKKVSKPPTTRRKPAPGSRAAAAAAVDPALFAPLTEGEEAAALRVLLEDTRLRAMASVGRYRVVGAEPLVLKAPSPHRGARLARVVVYDYAADRCVTGCINLDDDTVCHLAFSGAQPVLSADEEDAAIEVVLEDERVAALLEHDDITVAAMSYWSKNPTDLPYHRRTAAVVLGEPPQVIAVVDLLDRSVLEVVPAEEW